MAGSDFLHTISEGCIEAGIAKSTMYRHWHKGIGPKVVHIGGRRYISKETLREWIRGLEADAFSTKPAAVPDTAPMTSVQDEPSMNLSTAATAVAKITLAPPSRLNAYTPVGIQNLGLGRRRREPR